MTRVFGLGAAVILALGTIGAASADQDKHVKVINETEHNIVQFYASRVGTNDWEEDVLDVDILKPGQSVSVNFGGSDFCMYDFKAVFDDGDVLIRKRVNVCELSVYRYSE